jgi:hypothetical protein
MKKMYRVLFVSALLGFFALQTNATQWTVSNNPLFIAQFTSLQTALDSASAGDTIYVYRSRTQYGSFNISKPVHLIGAGYYGTIVGNDDLTSAVFSILSDSVFIEGFHTSIGVGAGDKLVKSILLSRINGDIQLINVEDCVITNSLIGTILGNSIKSYKIFVLNNIIQSYIINRKGNILISNNLFVYNYNCNGRIVLGYCNVYKTQTAIIQNNIFVNATPSGVEYSSFNNNITFQTGQDILPYGNNSGDDNITSTSPMFRGNNYQSYTNAQIVTNSIDYRLADDSPCINAGTDSTDIGITGGVYPWPLNDNGTLDYTGKPSLPQLVNFSLKPAVVGTDGTLDYTGKPSLPQLVNFSLKPAVVGTDGTLRFNVKGTKGK